VERRRRGRRDTGERSAKRTLRLLRSFAVIIIIDPPSSPSLPVPRPPFSLFLFFSLFRSPFDLFGTALLLDAAELGCRVEYPPLSVGGVSRLGWDSSWEDRGETLLLEEWMEVWEGDGERGFVPS
jgi:hypothetical protein